MTELKILQTYIFSVILLVIGYSVFESDYIIAVKFQEVFYVYINMLIVYHIKKYTGSFSHILLVFLFMIFFFGGIRLLADLFSFGVEDLRTTMFISYLISKEANVRALLNINLSLLCLGIGQFYYYKKYGRPTSKSIPIRLLSLPRNVTFILFWGGLAIKAYTSFKQLSNLIAFGYHAMFTGDGGESIPIYLRILSLLPVFIALGNVGKSKKWIWLFVVYLTLDLSTGQRGMAALSAVVFIYVLSRLELIRLNAVKVGIVSFLAIVLFIFMSNFRNEKATTMEDLLIKEFLWQQGTSINVLQCAVMEYENLDYNFKDMFGNLYSTFSFLDNSYERGVESTLDQTLHYKVWSKYISHHMNSNLYYAGLGMGGNYIGQCFAVGKELMVVLVNLLIPFFLMFLDRRIFWGSLVWSFFFFNVLQNFLYIPRDNLFTFLTASIEPLLASIFLQVLLVKFLKKRL